MLDETKKAEVCVALVNVLNDRELMGGHGIICLMEAAAFVMSRTTENAFLALQEGLPAAIGSLRIAFIRRIPEIMERLNNEKAAKVKLDA